MPLSNGMEKGAGCENNKKKSGPLWGQHAAHRFFPLSGGVEQGGEY